MGSRVAEHVLPSGQVLAVHHGDLTEEAVDVIVNAANEGLVLGGGVAGAIRRRGGDTIQRECHAWVAAHGPAGHDRPALTGAGRLPCRAIIHAVGPVWGSGDEAAKLETAYRAALELADRQGFRSIAFPSLSTGIFGFPVERAAPIALASARTFAERFPESSVREIRFTLIDAATVDVFRRTLVA
jgi:O-acetyl-ADP-ribose deacetylase (regulator of RNase III)